MKNLLLLFLVSFALFWVGCEKEELVNLKETTPRHINLNVSSTSVVDSSVGGGKQEVENNSEVSSEPTCCELGTQMSVFYDDDDEKILFSTPARGPLSGGQFLGRRLVRQISVNNVLVLDDEIPVAAPCAEGNASAFLDYSILGECPDLIRVVFAFEYLEDGEFVNCVRRTYFHKDYRISNNADGTFCDPPAEPTPVDDCEPFC